MTSPREPSAAHAARLFERVTLEPREDLIAVGGRLWPSVVLQGYRHGVFPWFDAEDPVLWWSPDPRGILPIQRLHVPRRLVRTIRSSRFEIRLDTEFDEVMAGCAEARSDGTWIHDAMRVCYGELHRRGHAHACEAWRGGRLVGGVYGVAFGAGFAAESMFHRERDASKVALVALVRHLQRRGFRLLDVQYATPHLVRFGATTIPRADYLARVRAVRDEPVAF